MVNILREHPVLVSLIVVIIIEMMVPSRGNKWDSMINLMIISLVVWGVLAVLRFSVLVKENKTDNIGWVDGLITLPVELVSIFICGIVAILTVLVYIILYTVDYFIGSKYYYRFNDYVIERIIRSSNDTV